MLKLSGAILPLKHILMAAFFLLFSAFIFAQQSQDTTISKQINLDQLIITAERNPVLFEQLKRSVQVFTKKDIEILPVSTISELLAYALNTDVRNRGPFGIQSDISVRGGTYEQTLILLNGVNISDPQTGHHTMDIPIDLESVSRIEVLKGASARVFGPNAFNGVVNIITNENTKNSIQLKAVGGHYGYYSFYGNLNISSKNISQHFQLGTTGSDGFISNTDFKSSNFNYSAGIGSRKQMELQASYLKKDFGANSFYTPLYPNQYEATRTLFTSLKYKTNMSNLAPVVYFRRHYDRFQLFRYDAPAWYTSHNYHFTDVIGSNANIHVLQAKHTSASIGYDFRYELIRSNKLGDTLDKKIPVPNTTDVFYTFGKNRSSFGFFFQESFNYNGVAASAGVLVNYLSAYNKKIAFYPGIDFAYQIAPKLRWYTSGNRTMRLPTFTELYYNDKTSKGDPALKPETALAIESGFKYNGKGIQIHAAIFNRWGSNMIDWVKKSSSEPWQATNVTKVNVGGFESQIVANFHEIINASYFVSNATISYSYLFANKKSNEYMSRYILDILKHKADFTLSHKIIKKLSCSWVLSYQDREGGYIKFTNLIPEEQETPYNPVLQLDTRINYTFSKWVLFAEVNNAFNAEIIDYGNVPQPGRWIKAGVKFNSILP